MSLTIAITPGGHLRLESDPEVLPALTPERAAALQEAFASSSAAGLLALVSQELGQELPPALVFWRGVARRLFEAICALGEAGLFHQFHVLWLRMYLGLQKYSVTTAQPNKAIKQGSPGSFDSVPGGSLPPWAAIQSLIPPSCRSPRTLEVDLPCPA